MREGWISTALKNVCAVDKTKHNRSILPYVGLEHIESGTGRFIGRAEPAAVKSATFRFTANHVLYGRLRPYLNKVLLPDFEGHCSSEIFPLQVKSSLDRRFLYYWLTWEPVVKEIDGTSTGARMPRANVNKLLEFELPLPPLPEQKRIVAILDEAFAGIATAVANTEKNLANARELFESTLSQAFSHRDISWEQVLLEEILLEQPRNGWSPPAKNHADSGTPVLTLSSVTGFRFRPEKIKFTSAEVASTRHYWVHNDDLLMTRSNTSDLVGHVAIAENLSVQTIYPDPESVTVA